MKTLRARGGNKPGSEARAPAGLAGPRAVGVSESRPPEGHEDLKKLIHGYHGFGILSLIRALLFRGCRFFTLAIVGIVLLIGQWVGPVGFIAFKFTKGDMELCAGNAGIWARLLMASVAMIYFARLSLAALGHRRTRPREFEQYSMPEWWGVYRHLDLTLTSLLYDTFIFLANLLIVFQDRAVSDMIVDVLALEFFTTIDDQFKAAVIEYDSSFLYGIVLEKGSTKSGGAGRLEGGDYAARSSSWMPSAVKASPLTEIIFRPGDFSEEDNKRDEETAPSAVGPKPCCDGASGAFVVSIKATLFVVSTACRLGGPLCALLMIFYGPLCLGAPDST